MTATKTTRRVRCSPCDGTGTELGTRDGAIITRPCFWCDGAGSVEVFPADAPPVCPCCGRPGVVIEAESVCPDCTAYTVADDESFPS